MYKRIPEGIFFSNVILSFSLFFRLHYCIVSEVLEYSVRVVPSTFMLLYLRVNSPKKNEN